MIRRLALITGARRGIGLGIARCLAAGGCDLAITGLHPPTDAAEAVAALRALGADVLYLQADVADPAARERMLSEIRERFGLSLIHI